MAAPEDAYGCIFYGKWPRRCRWCSAPLKPVKSAVMCPTCDLKPAVPMAQGR